MSILLFSLKSQQLLEAKQALYHYHCTLEGMQTELTGLTVSLSIFDLYFVPSIYVL